MHGRVLAKMRGHHANGHIWKDLQNSCRKNGFLRFLKYFLALGEAVLAADWIAACKTFQGGCVTRDVIKDFRVDGRRPPLLYLHLAPPL